jgi:hypothetical protein
MKFRHLLIALAAFAAAPAFSQQLVNCIASTSTPCNTSAQTGNGTQGDPAWLAFGKLNADVTFLYANVPSYPLVVADGGTGGTTSTGSGAVVLAVNPVLSAPVTGGTTFTVTGCGTAAAVSGSGASGTFTVGTGASTCTFVFTINGATGMAAPHGWIANVDDVTAHLHCLNNGTVASTTTATVLCNSTVTTGDLITFSAVAF